MVTMLEWLSVATKRPRGFQRARPKLSPSRGEASRFIAMEILCERANVNAAQKLYDERRSIMFNYELRDGGAVVRDPSHGEHKPMLALFFRRACSFNKDKPR